MTRLDSKPARDRLIEAAKRLLWQRGIEATSPGAILRASGVGQGSLYHHFSGKPELAAVATRSLAADLQAETDALLADQTVPPIDRIRAYLDQERDALGGCRLGRLAFDPGRDTGTTAPVAAYFTALQGSLARLIDQAVADGDLTGTVDAVGLAAAIVACVQGGYVLAAATGDAGAMSRALRGLRQQLDAASSRSPRQDASQTEAPRPRQDASQTEARPGRPARPGQSASPRS